MSEYFGMYVDAYMKKASSMFKSDYDASVANSSYMEGIKTVSDLEAKGVMCKEMDGFMQPIFYK